MGLCCGSVASRERQAKKAAKKKEAVNFSRTMLGTLPSVALHGILANAFFFSG